MVRFDVRRHVDLHGLPVHEARFLVPHGERPERLRLRVEPTEFHRQGRRAATVEVLRDLLPGVRVVPPRRRHADL